MIGTAIVVIAKSPAPGRVKTRLCPPCTPSSAAQLAAAALADTLDAVARTSAGARVLALDGPPGPWIPEGFVIVPQRGGGLAERLANARAAVTGPAIVVGMDTPQITSALLEDVIEALHAPGVDAVLGPADDGGWWVIGLHKADPRVFAGVPMSTPGTCAGQRARLAALGLCTVLVPQLRDVDTFDDALAVARAHPGLRFSAGVAAHAGRAALAEDAG